MGHIMSAPIHLGSGVYATFDGTTIRLMSDNPELPDNIINADETVSMNLLDFIKDCYGIKGG